MSNSLPKITEKDIQQLSTTQSFQRGLNYYQRGALFELVRQGNEVRAYCEGSDYQPYRVTATLNLGGVAHTSCTCPYDWGGICKHIVALLLTVANQPELFHIIPPLDELLAERSREELIGIIREMLNREPSLTRLLELPVQPDRNTGLDLEAYRRQIGYALRSARNYDYHSANNVLTELGALVQTAARFQKGSDWLNAGALYALILNEIVPRYDELYDDDGDISLDLQTCAEGLGVCLEKEEVDKQTRRAWLEALLAAELKDVEMGGLDLAFPAGDIVVEQATDDEWLWIEEQVKQAIAAQSNSVSSWGQERLVSFLIARLEARGRDDEAQDLIFEYGSAEQQAFLLIKQKRFEEAVNIARRSFSGYSGLVLRFADALVAAGGSEQAEAYVSSLLNTKNRSSYLTWLAEYARQTDRHAIALARWQESLLETPRLDTYKQLQKTALKLNCWPDLRQEILNKLEKKGTGTVLIEIALDEKDIPRALELLSRLKNWAASRYEMRIAKAAEESYPQASINLYRRQMERLISARGRGNYQTAAALAHRIKELYQKQNNLADWQKFITHLQQDYRQLPALQDEIKKAGLLQ